MCSDALCRNNDEEHRGTLIQSCQPVRLSLRLPDERSVFTINVSDTVPVDLSDDHWLLRQRERADFRGIFIVSRD